MRTTTERRISEPDLNLLKRLFPRGLGGLLPDERTRFLAVCAVVGVVAAIAAIAFRLALRGLQAAFFGAEGGDLLAAAAGMVWWKRLLLPAAGGAAAAALAELVTRRGGGGGVAGIMEAVSLKKGVVSLRSAVAKGACSLFSIASGGSIGREGPIIQLASAVASRAGRLLALPEERLRVLVACGAAAGFAAAYNTPIAATLFVIEVVACTTSIELVGPVAVSAVLSTVVTHAALGAGPLYSAKTFALVSAWELVPYTCLAFASALLATVFLGSLDAAEWFFARTFRSRVVRAVAGGLAVGVIAIWLPHVYGNGYETTAAILGQGYGVQMLGLLLAAKLFATASTVGSGGAGGVFTPTLLLGAALGAAVGDVAHALAPAHTGPPAAYALVGMAALLAATTHAPLLATMFVYEVTRDYEIILPLLLTSYVATGLTRKLRPLSIYEEEAARRGVDLDRNLEERALRSLRASALVTPVTPLAPDLSLAAVLDVFQATQALSLCVTDAQGRLVGLIDLHLARERLAAADTIGVTAASLARPIPAVLADTTGHKVVEAFTRAGRDEVPVIDAMGRLLGLATRRHLTAAIDRDIIRRGLRVAESMDTRRIRLSDLPPIATPPVKPSAR